jgi:hypothetical protein
MVFLQALLELHFNTLHIDPLLLARTPCTEQVPPSPSRTVGLRPEHSTVYRLWKLSTWPSAAWVGRTRPRPWLGARTLPPTRHAGAPTRHTLRRPVASHGNALPGRAAAAAVRRRSAWHDATSARLHGRLRQSASDRPSRHRWQRPCRTTLPSIRRSLPRTRCPLPRARCTLPALSSVSAGCFELVGEASGLPSVADIHTIGAKVNVTARSLSGVFL